MNARTTEKLGRREITKFDMDGGRVFVGIKVNGRISHRNSFAFPTDVAADEYIGQIREQEAKKNGEQAAKRGRLAELKAAWVNPYKVGDLLNYSWGYDQTNQEFAQIVAVGARSVTIREISRHSIRATGSMSDVVAPVKDHFTGEPVVKVITFSVYRDELYARIPAPHGSWSPVGDRESFHRSWYC
jgi:hypothetical protein